MSAPRLVDLGALATAPAHVAACVEGVARGATVGPESGCPNWAPYAVLHFARLAGVHVDVDWDPATCTLTARPAETPDERAGREERRARAGLCQRSRACSRPLAPGHARLCDPCLAVARGIFENEAAL